MVGRHTSADAAEALEAAGGDVKAVPGAVAG